MFICIDAALQDFLTLLEWFCYGCLFLQVIIVHKLCSTWRREGHLSFFNHGFVSISTHTHKHKSNERHKSTSNFDFSLLSRFLYMIGLTLPTSAFMVYHHRHHHVYHHQHHHLHHQRLPGLSPLPDWQARHG